MLEWLHDISAEAREIILAIEDVNKPSINYISLENTESIWIVPDGSLRVPQSILNLLDPGRCNICPEVHIDWEKARF